MSPTIRGVELNEQWVFIVQKKKIGSGYLRKSNYPLPRPEEWTIIPPLSQLDYYTSHLNKKQRSRLGVVVVVVGKKRSVTKSKEKMKDEESQAQLLSTTSSSTINNGKKEKEGGSFLLLGGRLFGRGRYKLWALAAIILLAFWSMLTGSVTLKWSSSAASTLNPLSDHFDDSPLHNDLDILVIPLSTLIYICFRSPILTKLIDWYLGRKEVEDREKVVRQMWDVYSHSRSIQLPRFWQEAFEAAYEDLTSDLPSVRNHAVSEIAKMSLLSLSLSLHHINNNKAPVEEKQSRDREDKKEPVTTNGTVK